MKPLADDPANSDEVRAARAAAQGRFLSPGARFGPYRLIRALGKGGFAEVWEAESEVNGRRVALKVLTELRAESARALERFQQEGRLAASLANPHCVYVFDAGAHEGFPYITMELMTGGTLAERIERGPLHAPAAVDAVLDVLEGLESAQQAGILHRDVKPSNVFLDADGRAKIGDFGISKSLEVDSRLSQTGAFLGTPYYASPEQIAAEPLDLRSDLYSVGAMLYELVTGKLPYAGTNASQVLAQVLTREPAPFAQHGVKVPVGLQRVILRLLAKAKEKRFQSYAQLRAALQPFSSRGLVPGALAPRFGAIVVDVLVCLPVALLLSTASIRQVFRGALPLASLALPLLQFAYFTLTERYWGGSVGKRLLGLRVTTAEGAAPSLGRVALRAAVFLLCFAGPGVLMQAITAGGMSLVGRPLLRLLQPLVQLAGYGALASTMRRRNGYAGLHELASGTRVVAVLARQGRGVVPRAAPAVEPSPAGAAFGPYRATGTVWRLGHEALLVARDAELHRDVWIHEFRNGAAAPSIERLRARGAGSLPWLQRGGREGQGEGEGIEWDAYGAPQGTTLVRWAAERGGLGWREMRDVLDSLARELASRCARDGTAGPLSPRRVWVDPSGRALLLDFPVEGPGDEAAVEVTPATWRQFLARVATLGFTGGPGEGPPRVPLPEYARAVVSGLFDGGSAPAGRPIADFTAALEQVAARPSEVSRWRRAGPFAVLALLPAFMILLRLLVPVMTAGMPPWYRDLTLNGDAYREALRRADSASPSDTASRRTAEAVRLVFAAAVAEARRAPQFGGPIVNALPANFRAALDSAVARHPAPDSQQVAAARAWLATHVAVPRLRGGPAGVLKSLLQSLSVMGYLGAAGVVLALLLRGAALLSLFGIGVVRPDGAPAGRVRCGARALVAWSPLLLLLALTSAPPGVRVDAEAGPQMTVRSVEAPRRAAGSTGASVPVWLSWALCAVAVGGAAAAVWRPTRGLAERASGVVLVPR